MKEIEAKYQDPWERLCEVLMEWLKCNYNTEKFGMPTWRKVVEVVASSSGASDNALAEKIAKDHQCESSIYIQLFELCLVVFYDSFLTVGIDNSFVEIIFCKAMLMHQFLVSGPFLVEKTGRRARL